LIRLAIHTLALDPRRPPNVAAEEMFWGEWEGYWRVRVGEFRVIYDINDRATQVTILRVRYRSEVYEGGPGDR
jgi:mRNA-degrading endonuclease RelE of RelBE toxin-antitoxin system